MSEAGWRTDKPTVAGWYWIRDPRFVLSGGVKVVYITTKDLMMDWGSTAEFLGPITPDAYAAGWRAGLEWAVKEVKREIYLGLPNITATQRTVAVNFVHDWMHRKLQRIAEQIEAQAQGGEHGT